MTTTVISQPSLSSRSHNSSTCCEENARSTYEKLRMSFDSALCDTRVFIHRKERDAIVAAGYPNLIGNSEDAVLFRKLMKAPRTEEGEIVISQRWYRKIMKTADRRQRGTGSKCRSAEAHVKRLIKEIIGGDVKFSRSQRPTDEKNGVAVRITLLRLPDALHQAVYLRDRDVYTRAGLVYVHNGKRVSPADLRLRLKERRHTAAELNALCPVPSLAEFYTYLNETLDQHVFGRLIGEEELDAALAVIDKIRTRAQDADKWVERSTDAQWRKYWQGQSRRLWAATEQHEDALKELMWVPQPIYTMSERTPRFYARGRSLQTVSMLMRRALLHRTVELDLTSAQAAIFAMLFDIKPLQRLLAEEQAGGGPSLWEYLCAQVDIVGEEVAALKPALKCTLVYACCFGMEKKNLLMERRRVTNGTAKSLESADVRAGLRRLRQTGREWRKKLLECEVIDAWIAARDRAIARIETHGGMADFWGIWQAIGADRDAKSVLAYVVQSYEVGMLEPVMEAAMKAANDPAHGWKIVLWQHDGFNISCRASDVGRVVCHLQALVAERAAALGVITSLKAKYNGL